MRTGLLIVFAHTIMFLSAHYCLAQDADSRRQEIVYQNMRTDLSLLERVKTATNTVDARSTAETLVTNTDVLFTRLADQDLLNDKLNAYKVQWHQFKPSLLNNPQSAAIHAKAVAFYENINYAAKGDKATVNVASTKGSGASVKYAKEVDAARGRFQDWGGETTTDFKELERGNWIFKLFRGGKETGRTGPVSCTDTESPKTVTVTER